MVLILHREQCYPNLKITYFSTNLCHYEAPKLNKLSNLLSNKNYAKP